MPATSRTAGPTPLRREYGAPTLAHAKAREAEMNK